MCEEPQGGDTIKEWKPRRATFSTAHLLQQGLHLPFLPLLAAPVWVVLQPIEVGLRSACGGGGREGQSTEPSPATLNYCLSPAVAKCTLAITLGHSPGTSMLVKPPLCPTPNTSSKGQNWSPCTWPESRWVR